MNRILIAEDEARIASFLEKGLKANGFVTTSVTDGPGVLHHARTDEHDLLVLDLGLPDIDGLAVLEQLRGSGSRMPFLALTARDDVRDTVTQGQVLSREQLLNQLWGYDHDPGSNIVDVYVGHLRRKLVPDVIQTVRGMGYRFEAAALT